MESSDYVEKQKPKKQLTQKQLDALAKNREKARIKIMENKKKLDMLNDLQKSTGSAHSPLESTQVRHVIDPDLLNKVNSIENLILQQKLEKEKRRSMKQAVSDYPEKKMPTDFLNYRNDPNERKYVHYEPEPEYIYEPEPVYKPAFSIFR